MEFFYCPYIFVINIISNVKLDDLNQAHTLLLLISCFCFWFKETKEQIINPVSESLMLPVRFLDVRLEASSDVVGAGSGNMMEFLVCSSNVSGNPFEWPVE